MSTDSSRSTGSSEPRRIGRYLVFEEFARGGMATVHLGRLDGSAGFQRVVAIKRLNKETASDSQTRASIQDEALIASRIVHRNVAQVLDVVESDGELALVMELVQGVSLGTLLRAARTLNAQVPAPVAAAVIADVAEGLQAAHDATDAEGKPLEIVHRDMSPQNILVGADGLARVLDFGIAKARVQSQYTTPGTLKGKIAYMAPEQIHGRASRASDIYSTGLVLYEALTGVRAIGDFSTEAEGMAAVLLGKIQPLHELRPSTPAALVQIVERAIAKEPEQRFANARQFADALRTWGAGSTDAVAGWVTLLAAEPLEELRKRIRRVESSKVGSPAAPKRRWWPVAAGAAAVAIALAIWAALPPPAQDTAPAPPAPTVTAVAPPTSSPPPTPVASDPPPAEPVVHRHGPRKARSASKDCDPPFRIDSLGHKQYKPECF